MQYRIGNRNRASLGNSQQRKPFQVQRVDNRFQIGHECAKGNVLHLPVGQAIPPLVKSNQSAGFGEFAKKMPPDRALPFIFQMAHPVRRLEQRRAGSHDGIGDLGAVRCNAGSYLLLLIAGLWQFTAGVSLQPLIRRKIFRGQRRNIFGSETEYTDRSGNILECLLATIGKRKRELIPDLIEAGYDIINPVQTNCRNMEPERLKREFGRDITFWGGGCDTRNILNHATPDEVKDHVKKRIEIFSQGGGFIFNTVHNILPDVPPENIVAMFEAISE